MAIASDFIPKGIVELPTKSELQRTDNFAVVSGNVNNFKTYQTSFGNVVDKISSDFQNFSFNSITANNITVNDTLSSKEICCDSIYVETIKAETVEIPGSVIRIEDINEYDDLPDENTTVYCFSQISSENGRLVGGRKQVVPDSRLDCRNLSNHIDSESQNIKNILEQYITELEQKIKNIEISVSNIESNTNQSDMNLAIDTNNIIDITPLIPKIDKIGTDGETGCSSFYEIPFGGTLGVNFGHYYTIDSYDANNPVTVEPYLFAKSGSGTTALNTQNATGNDKPTVFIKVKKGMNIATSNNKETNAERIKNCILLYPELNDDMFASDRTIEINELLYDPNSGSNKGDMYYYQYLSAYDYYKNTTNDKSKYQVFYIDLQNISSKEQSLTCSIFRCVDVSKDFDQHYLSGNNAPNKLTPKSGKIEYHNGYNLKTDSFKIPANSTITRKYVVGPEDVLLIFDNQPSYTSTSKSGTYIRTINAKKIMGNSVILLSRGYVDINENTNYCMTVDVNKITKESDLINLKNIESNWENPTQLMSLEIDGPDTIKQGEEQKYSISAFYSKDIVKELTSYSDCTLSIEGYGTILKDQDFVTISAAEEEGQIYLSAWYNDLGSTVSNTINIEVTSEEEEEPENDDEDTKEESTEEPQLMSSNRMLFGDSNDEEPELRQELKVEYIDANTNELCSYDITSFNAYDLRDSIGENNTLSIIGSKNCPIINIGDDVFSNTSCVNAVYIPATVKTLGKNVFKNCTELKEANIPFVTETLQSVFEGCGKLTKLKTGGTLQNIGDKFYKNCTSLQSIVIPKKVSRIGTEAFMGCESVKNMIFLDNVADIDGTSFDGCSNLYTFIVSKNNTNLNENNGTLYSYDYTRLIANPTPEERENIRYSVNKIDERAFRGTQNLKSVTFNANVKDIGLSSFNNCTNLNTIVFLPDECPQISTDAFTTGREESGVVYLTPENKNNYATTRDDGTITPLSNKNLPTCPPYSYYVLPLVFKMSTTKNKFSNLDFKLYEFNENKEGVNVEVDFGDGTLSSFALSAITGYKARTPHEIKVTKDYTNSPIDSATKLNPIVTVKFTDTDVNVLSIGNVFQSYKQISEIWLPQSIQRIGENFANGSTSLTAIHMSNCNELTSIQKNAFYGTSITEIKLPSSMKTLGDGCFSQCNSLLSIDFSNNTEIGIIPTKMCWTNNKNTSLMYVNLSSVNNDKGITDIYESAFQGCCNMKTLVLPQNIKTIQKNAFNGCTNISSTLDFKKCEVIGDYAFYKCTNISEIKIGGSHEKDVSIGSNAFNGCTNISAITLNLKAEQLTTTSSAGKITANIKSGAFTGVGTNAINAIKDIKNKYSVSDLRKNGYNIIKVPKGEIENYIDTSNYTLQKVFNGLLPKPVDPNYTNQLASTDIRWIYDEMS